MARFQSSIFRLPLLSSPPSSGEAEAEGIADGEKQAGVCAQNNLLISLPEDLLLKIMLSLSAEDILLSIFLGMWASLVCRRLYYHTIRSEEFVNLHLRQQTDEYGLLFKFINVDQHSSQRKKTAMAKFSSSIFRRPWSAEIEAEDEKQAVPCAQNNLLISLPDDLLFKILFNLSAQDIYTASLACRSLYCRTILSDKFVNLHLQKTDEYGLFFRYAPTYDYQHLSQHAVFVSMKQGRVTVSNYYAYKFRYGLETSCNDHIIEDTEALPQVHVANPVTGRTFQLPPLPENAERICYSVGYAEASKAYKVALLYSDWRSSARWRKGARWAMLTVGVDKSWRYLVTDHMTEYTIGSVLVTEGFIHSISYSIYGYTVLTLNVETEVVMEMRAPFPVDSLSLMYWYLSTGKSLTVVHQVENGVFRVWEMVLGEYYSYYWREWERQIVLGSEFHDLFHIQPVGWLQQMEVLVFKGSSRNEPCFFFYVVIATGEFGWINPISSNKEWLAGEFYTILGSVLPHKTPLSTHLLS
ncbi:Unknown protein [Striga hermonthica]|uniref:F-box domain-containing protein n=1 Tax=Striga hermonthica TaxID=68872 RepID=A0A9N7R3V7_STRHE|nr:Unknown protein [Striga hermonthica]